MGSKLVPPLDDTKQNMRSDADESALASGSRWIIFPVGAVHPAPTPMKTIARYVWAAATLGGLFLATGCTSTSSAQGRNHATGQMRPTSEFAVIDSSFGRELTDQEMSQLRAGVAKYLEGQGVARSGEYYVRVDFSPTKPDAPGDWVVVKFTSLPASNYTLIAAYPVIGPDDYYPDVFAYGPGYGYGYGYWGSSYGYYDPPAYYPTNYHPRPFPGTSHRGDDGNKPGDHRKGDKDDHPRGGTPTHYDGPRDHNGDTSHRHYQPDNPHRSPRPIDSGGGAGRPEYSPRSNDGGGSRSFSPSSSSSSGSSYSAPATQSSVSAPATYSAPEAGVGARDQRQQN